MPERHLTVEKATGLVQEGESLYLYSDVASSNRAVDVARNTLLTSHLLGRLATQHGSEFLLHVGDEPMAEAVATNAPRGDNRNFLGLMREFAREEAKKPISQIFTFKAMLIQTAREWEAQLVSSHPTPVEARICQYAPLLQKHREPGRFHHLLTRAVADALCAIYLDLLDATKSTGRRDEEEQTRQQATMAACILKDIAYVTTAKAPSGIDIAKIHPRVSAYLLRKDADFLDLSQLRPELLKARLADRTMEEAVRAVMEHENHTTKSRIAQCVIKGTLYCDWLLGQNMPDVPLIKDDLIRLGHFDALEMANYLNMAMLVKNPAILAAARAGAEENNLVRLQVYRRHLTSKGMDFPIEDRSELNQDFKAFFSQFGNYTPAGFLFLRNLVDYFNRLSLQQIGEETRMTRLKEYAQKLHVLLLK